MGPIASNRGVQAAHPTARIQASPIDAATERTGRCHQSDAAVIESPADQSWAEFCRALAAPVLLLPGMDWMDA